MAAVPMIVAVITINFLLIHLAPGDLTTVFFGDFVPSQEQVQELSHRLGLDRPLYVQYFTYLGTLLQGDLGFSYLTRTPVLTLILGRVGATALLMLSSLALFTAIGVALGSFVARQPYSLADNVNAVLSLVGYSIPVFWLGQIALLVFSLRLGLLPTQGMVDVRAGYQGWAHVGDVALHLVLPVTVLGMRYLAINARLMRASMIEALGQDFVVAARAKGLREATVQFHAFRNAIIPVVTIFGTNIGELLSGSVLIEIVFGWPGLGRLMYDAIFARDYPVLMGLFVFISVGVVTANLITDITYGALDPRVRRT
jgi:ABC-type dipeptide/oligopeptide/nickel transport system permease component